MLRKTVDRRAIAEMGMDRSEGRLVKGYLNCQPVFGAICRQCISYTDFPLPAITLQLEDGLLMLPSER